MIKFIAAIDDKLGLAKDGKLPWSLPTDRKFFRQSTLHQTVLMGWGTYASMNYQPLPDRHNVIVTHNPQDRDDVEFIDDPRGYLEQATEDTWVIGGGNVFAQVLDLADQLYLTRVGGDFGCDVFFPPFEDKFTLVSQTPTQEENGTPFCFEVWEPRKTAKKQV